MPIKKPDTCPFCGSTAVVRKSFLDSKEWWVACKECGALGPFKKTRKEAVNEWNRRDITEAHG
jgi:Lar family restriction alleviation protein